MIWPPLKAWTSRRDINGNNHFVAINYGGKNSSRWVLFMSVIDSKVIVKAFWPQLTDSSIWECGWDEDISSNPSIPEENINIAESINCSDPSIDSGLTMPITKTCIRPWFSNL